jgi:hypothetical protein
VHTIASNNDSDIASIIPLAGKLETDTDTLNSSLLAKLQPSLVGISERMNELLESQQVTDCMMRKRLLADASSFNVESNCEIEKWTRKSQFQKGN